MKHIYFTVTNDLTYDQRMHRICHSLATGGYKVTLVGRRLKSSLPLQNKSYLQKRLQCYFNKGFLFYIEFNIRLFFYLAFKKMNGICAIDLDTILPVLAISAIKGTKRIYDAHEYFTELKEVRTRPTIKKIWDAIESFALPKYNFCYTVGEGLAEVYSKKYNKSFIAIRNVPVLKPLPPITAADKFILFQGAVNEARGFEYLIPAMQKISYPLIVCGDGNFMQQLKQLITENNVADKVTLKGMMTPEELWEYAPKATIGMGLAEKEGTNQFLALPNKFFDYIHAGVPQIAMNYPEYQRINNEYNVAVLIDELNVDLIASTINATMQNENLINELKHNCLIAREEFNWQKEEKKLIHFYNSIFSPLH